MKKRVTIILRIVPTLLIWGFAAVPAALAQFTALPEVSKPFAGDPRLEPIPRFPIHLPNVTTFAKGVPITMRFPPRVNGQTISDGDGHADLYVLFYEDTGLRVNQPVILEAVPKGAVENVTDRVARLYSAIWELHAVTVDPAYDPTNLATRIDSVLKVETSPLVKRDFQTNIFLNCPVVPNGSTVDPGSAKPEQAFFEGQGVTIVPYDVDDGFAVPQILFKFEDNFGNTLPIGGPPHLVASRLPGDPFYTAIWELWTVKAPTGVDVTTLKNKADFIDSPNGVPKPGFKVTSSGIRLNCPVIAVNGVPVPIEDAFSLLTSSGRFQPNKFPKDIPEKQFTKSRSFFITEVTPCCPPIPPASGPSGVFASFPPSEPVNKGNVIPLILVDPFQLASSGPNSTGPIIRIDQAELDAAYLNNFPPRLPAAIERNIATFISAKLLPPEWAPGIRPYPDRLGLVGRALNELVWKPEQGANTKDTLSCVACHSQPASGGASRGLYTMVPGGDGPALRSNAASMFGSGAAELLVQQLKAKGANITFAHGSLGTRDAIRRFVSRAFRNHVGIESAEVVAERTNNPAGFDPVTDLDADGVANELSVGEVTAMATFLLNLPAPDIASASARAALGITGQQIQEGRRRFRPSIDNGGLGCAVCHTIFHPLSSNIFQLKNPQTSFVLPIPVSHHRADLDDVREGYATSVGQMGVRLFGDFKLHKMGPLMKASGVDTMKTAELWDVGAAFPYLRDGGRGSNLDATILAHEGLLLSNINITRGPQVNSSVGGVVVSTQTVTIKNLSAAPIFASPTQPIHVTVTGPMSPGILARNAAGFGVDGKRRQGSQWLITSSIPALGSVNVVLSFENPQLMLLQYNLAVQSHLGYSEAVANIEAYRSLPKGQREDVVRFLRVQLIANKIGEGSGAPAGRPPDRPLDPLGP